MFFLATQPQYRQDGVVQPPVVYQPTAPVADQSIQYQNQQPIVYQQQINYQPVRL